MRVRDSPPRRREHRAKRIEKREGKGPEDSNPFLSFLSPSAFSAPQAKRAVTFLQYFPVPNVTPRFRVTRLGPIAARFLSRYWNVTGNCVPSSP